jgi:glycosyltransferase involved in cell wall biosynthesis
MICVKDISFVIIAKNEEFGIEKCLRSITSMDLSDCQVICVDSLSTDGTREAMERYAARYPELVEIHDCLGLLSTNAAVARNVGRTYVRKSIVLFVDGDVEVNPEFIQKGAEVIRAGRAALVTGPLHEWRYSAGFAEVTRVCGARREILREQAIFSTGGIFMLSTDVVRTVGLWDETLTTYEDHDYTLRVTRRAKGLALTVPIGIHHTLESNYTTRMIQQLRRLYPMDCGRVIRRFLLVHPVGTYWLLRYSTPGLCGLLVLFMFLVSVIVCAVADWPYCVALLLPGGFCAADLARCAFRRRSITSRFLINYAGAPLVLAGVFLNRPMHVRAGARPQGAPIAADTQSEL